MTLISTDVAHVQPGDQIIHMQQIVMVKAIDGPDRIGTYDLFLQDSQGKQALAVANGSVTLVR